ncbi:MAG: hypothetical protein K2K56_13515 [Lachnospiraceae bacterium]|nr:hypothetical protein [Lachnospiraceae bacterium]
MMIQILLFGLLREVASFLAYWKFKGDADDFSKGVHDGNSAFLLERSILIALVFISSVSGLK